MEVGTFGDGKDKITFQVKDESKRKILSYQGLTRDDSANFEEHPRPRKKPYMEYTGQAIGQMSMEIVAKASFGVNPLGVEKKLMKVREAAKAGYFTIGGRKVGKHRWVITSVHRDYESFGKVDGELVPTEIRFDVSLTEYPYKKSKSKKSSTKTNKGKNKNEKTGTTKKAKKTNYTLYTVAAGDTLFSIAKKKYGQGSKYTKIYSANQDGADGTTIIKDPNNICPGWILKIPS